MPAINSASSSKEATKRAKLIAEMQFLGQMASTETALFHQAAAAKLGLGITDMKTISTLTQEGPMTAGQIAKRLSLTTGAVTNVIGRLTRIDAVRRVADPDDRRKVIVEINPARTKDRKEVYASMGRSFEKFLENYTTQEIEFLVRYYKAAVELTKAEIAKLAE
ncbi:MAG TPA: MarR family transcriptional regulator [Candidatus Saccharimonadales bacterium]|nr:MarR family transcriptional regulator [Candidatus Saccharimonadales bacterium]